MKVLFCSPFVKSDKVVKGGINQWGQYIVSYWNQYADDTVDLIPVSFDRHTNVSESRLTISRFLLGIKDLFVPMSKAIYKTIKCRPDLMHICTSAGQGILKDLVLIAIAKIFGVKVALHLHFGRIPELMVSDNFEWKLLRIAIKNSDVVITMNQYTFEALNRNNFKNVCNLPNPIDVSVLKEIEKLKTQTVRKPKQMVFVGHVFKSKGVYEAVEACKSIDDVTLRLVGKCPDSVKEELIQLAGNSDKISWLKFTGELSHSQVLAELLQADIFVFPSYTEGFPNVILEAMACSCPIAASNVGAIPEMLDVDGNACGICYEPKSIEGVRKAILNLLDNPELKSHYAVMAKKRVEEKYAIPVVWKQLVAIWKCTLPSKMK